MTKRKWLPILAMLPVAASLASAQPMTTPNPRTNQTPHQFQFEKTERAQVNYLLFLPEGYDANASKLWPLILFLHGAGERGTNIWRVAIHGPPKNAPTLPKFPFIVVSPQCPEGRTWSRDVLVGLLDEVTQKYLVDTKRVYLTGLSMGGYGTWDLGIAHPDRFAAIAPICGGGQLLAGRDKPALKSLGVWAFHGAKDMVVPLEESERMVKALKKAGGQDVHLTVYPEAGHDSWTETYKDPKFYDWLLKHQRP